MESLGPVPESCLWKATFLEESPHNIFLSPPVDKCFSCDTSLQAHHPPTSVVCYTWNGPLPALKLTLRCEKCGINYRYEQYGNSKCGYKYYPTPRPFVHCSQLAYIERICCANMGAAG